MPERPQRAKPKVLDAPPTVFRGGGTPTVVTLAAGSADGEGPAPTGVAGAVTTAERAVIRPLADVLGESRVDAELQREMAAIASRLGVRRRHGRDARRGRAHPASARFDGSADELDLDRTMDLIVEHRPLTSEELYVRRPLRSRQSIVLLADVSGSMDGDKARLTAAAVGALAGRLLDDELTVIAFWQDLAVLRTRVVGVEPIALVDELMRIEPRGLTNVHAAIEIAARELARSRIAQRRIVLLSDCVHNAGPDPADAARSAPPTLVLLEQTGEHDAWIAARIARAGGGRVRPVRGIADVASALTSLLGD